MKLTPSQGLAWRYVLLTGLAAGLALSAFVAAPPPIELLAICVASLVPARHLPGGRYAFIAGVGTCAALAGLALGCARLAAIDRGALSLDPDTAVTLRAAVESSPRVVAGQTRFIAGTPEGRVMVAVPGPAPPDIDQGRIVSLRGVARGPMEWEEQWFRREGAAGVVVAERVRATGASRQGLTGTLDGIRRRAEAAIERGNPDPAAALLRGFVLGQDDKIAEPVRQDFRRSGLAHVLAVSGQNVMLLSLLAAPILALIGVPLRSRLVVIVAVIAIYVPIAGAGASIQRAGVMGAAGLVAALASRPQARWYALMLAAAVTLAIDPRATGDIGWQLSFAAVAGLIVAARSLTRLLSGSGPPTPARRLISEGLAMTLAATLATAPLVAHHFEVASLTALPANVLALPAIAPAMWLGMLAGALGQIPAFPVEPLSALGGYCAGYIGWVAHALGGEWAQVELSAPGPLATFLMTVGLLAGTRLACRAAERRRGLHVGEDSRRVPRRIALAVTATLACAWFATSMGGQPPSHPARFSLRMLDVGQGDAILLQQRNSSPILIDTGPPGDAAAERLGELGLDHLGALVLTHDDLDHSGALGEILATVEVDRLLTAAGTLPAACEAIRCPPITELTQGQTLRSGVLRMLVLWPGSESSATAGSEPNARSLVIQASVGEFDALLTGDAESELAPYRAGPMEVLKVAHHGSADSGLPRLLTATSPHLALISVGEGNSYGHPAPEAMDALGRAAVPVLRTDEEGEIVIEVRGDGWGVG